MGNTHIETGDSKRHKKLQSFNLYVLLSLRMSFKPKKLTAHNPHLFSFFRDMLRRQRRLRWNLKAVFVWAKQLQGGAKQLNSQAHWNCKYLTIWRTICWNLASVTAEEQHDRTFFFASSHCLYFLHVVSALVMATNHTATASVLLVLTGGVHQRAVKERERGSRCPNRLQWRPDIFPWISHRKN